MGPGVAISGVAGGGGGVMAALGPVGWGLMAVSVIGSLFGGGAKKREARRAEERKQVLIGELNILEKVDKQYQILMRGLQIYLVWLKI